MVGEEGDTSDYEEISYKGEHQSTEGEDYGVSIHAMQGTQGIHTLKMEGLVKRKQVQILIETGSTHNFISSSLVKNLVLALSTCEALT